MVVTRTKGKRGVKGIEVDGECVEDGCEKSQEMSTLAKRDQEE